MKIRDKRRTRTYIERWRNNNKEGWKEFNKQVKEEYEKGEIITDYEATMGKIKAILKNTAGKQTIRTDKPKGIKGQKVQ